MNNKPIFPDQNVGPQHYAHLKDDQLLITKIFPTIQGEGPFAGQRCVFVRLAGCNLGAKGIGGPGCKFCDTDFRFDQGTVMSIHEICETVWKLWHGMTGKRDGVLVIITGGEPMIQPNLVNFVLRAPSDWRFQIESNGRQILDGFPMGPYLVVSPKVSEPYNKQYTIPSAKVLGRADCLKFVVSADPDSVYCAVPTWVNEFDGPVYVSPMAVYREGVESPNKAAVSIWDEKVFDQEACAQNHAHAAGLAMRYGFVMTTQMHLYCAVE